MTASGRVPVAANVSFADAKRVAPRLGRRAAFGVFERQLGVESCRPELTSE